MINLFKKMFSSSPSSSNTSSSDPYDIYKKIESRRLASKAKGCVV